MKHNIKAFLSILLVVIMLFCLGACAKDTSGLGTLEIGDSSEDDTLEPLGGSDGQSTESTASEPTQTPESTESGTQFQIEEYSCDDFDCYIPLGWNVEHAVVDAGSGIYRIYIFIQDPADENNIIFYISGLDPFFTSASDKKTVIALSGSAYEWAPVLEEVSAAGVINEWASLYTTMDSTGFTAGTKYFKNYGISSILSSAVADGSTIDVTSSQALAEVTVPGASGTYGLLFANTLSKQYFDNVGVSFYTGYDNQGFVLSADRFEAESEGMIYCLNSLDLSKFKNYYGSSVGYTVSDETDAQTIALPEKISFK